MPWQRMATRTTTGVHARQYSTRRSVTDRRRRGMCGLRGLARTVYSLRSLREKTLSGIHASMATVRKKTSEVVWCINTSCKFQVDIDTDSGESVFHIRSRPSCPHYFRMSL